MLPLALDHVVARTAGSAIAIMLLSAVPFFLAEGFKHSEGNLDKVCRLIGWSMILFGFVVGAATGFIAVWTSTTLSDFLKIVITGGGIVCCAMPFGIYGTWLSDHQRLEAASFFKLIFYMILTAGIIVMVVAGFLGLWGVE